MAMKDRSDKAIKVAELKPGEAGRGVVRLDPELMTVMDIRVGDIVEIAGDKRTVAKVLRGGPRMPTAASSGWTAPREGTPGPPWTRRSR